MTEVLLQHWVCSFTGLDFMAKDPQSCPHCGNDDLPMANGHYRPDPYSRGFKLDPGKIRYKNPVKNEVP